MARTARFKPRRTPDGWRIIIPESVSESGKVQRRFFPTREEAEDFAATVRTHRTEYGKSSSILPPAWSDTTAQCRKLLGDRPPSDLLLAVREFLSRHDISARSVTVATACREFIAARSHRTEKHLADYRRLPVRFPGLAEKLLAEITPAEIQKALASLPGPSRNLQLRLIRAVFNFGIKRDWLAESPCAKVEAAHIPAPRIPVLTAKQCLALFGTASKAAPDLCPMLALELFAGVRPAEAEKLHWHDMDLTDNVLTIPADAAKTRRARHITLHPTARAWIDWHVARGGHTSGLIAPATGTGLRTTLRAIRKSAGITPWPQDCLRHTFASVALAAGWRDIGALCLDLGHTSQAMLHKHYHRAVRRAEAEAVLAVLPPREKSNVIPLRQSA